MTKLNKQEVNALAAKALREIEQKIEDKRREKLKDYEPSTFYIKMKNLLEKIMYRNIQINTLEEEISELENECSSEFNKVFGRGWRNFSVSNHDGIDAYLDAIKEHEINVDKVPNIEILKEEIVIAAIDESFNVESCINNLVEKFN